jgi:hypothetical protein
MTPEEIRKRDMDAIQAAIKAYGSQAEQIAEARRVTEARITELRESADKVDNIMAVLMSSFCGGPYLDETEAQVKAVAIYTLVQEWNR